MENNVLFVINGGMGDQVCAEPTIRFVLKTLPEIKLSILTAFPELFAHLNGIKNRFTLGVDNLDTSQFIVRGTYPGDNDDLGRMLSSAHTNGVDYCAMMALKWNLPLAYREINLKGIRPKPGSTAYDELVPRIGHDAVLIHPGKSFQSKTFPADWWRRVVLSIANEGLFPVLIGSDIGVTGVLDLGEFKSIDYLDLRNKLSTEELIWSLQKCRVVLTNDSAPLHIAASKPFDEAFHSGPTIGFFATAKHPDFLLHYRRGQLGRRMQNLSIGGVWSRPGLNLNLKEASESEILSWLPPAHSVGVWAASQ